MEHSEEGLSMSGNNVERRNFLRGAVCIATVGIASGSVLAGCSDPGPVGPVRGTMPAQRRT